MKCGGIRMALILLAAFLFSEPVYGKAVSTENLDIPVIVKWQEGHGFGENGRMIYDGWAFDPENGSYVKFKDGCVLVKADCILETDDYDAYFTDTEAMAGTLAVRGEVIKYFSGSIRVVVENVDTHMEKTCCLTPENGYRYNLLVSKGRYQVKEAEAIWNETHYKVNIGTEVLEIEDDNTCLIEIQVLPEGSKLDDEAAWDWVNESGSGTGIAEPIPRDAHESSYGKRKEITSMHWPEIYLLIVIFIAVYGLYRYWTKRRR